MNKETKRYTVWILLGLAVLLALPLVTYKYFILFLLDLALLWFLGRLGWYNLADIKKQVKDTFVEKA